MVLTQRMGAKKWILAYFFVVLVGGAAQAQQNWMDAIGSVLDGTARWLNRVGEKSEDLIQPNYGFLSDLQVNDFTGLVVDSHTFEDTFPVLEAPLISLTNRFGEIHVSTWDSQVVRVVAKITVGAATSETAGQVSRGIEIRATATEAQLDIKAVEPDTRALGRVQIVVDYDVMIPRDANLDCKNTWGDVQITGVGGALNLDCMYGKVDLTKLQGPVRVRAHGELPLTARGLRQGGHFDLSGTLAEFRDVAGTLQVNSSMGVVELHELADESTVDVSNNSGAIILYMPAQAAPDLTATALFGAVHSDLPTEQTVRGNVYLARSDNPASKQHIELHSMFNDVVIRYEGATGPVPVAALGKDGSEPYSDVLTKTLPAPEGTQLTVTAALGDIRIVGIDEDAMHIKATKFARVQTAANARAALESLDVRITSADNRVEVGTSIIGDPAALDCTACRVDLEIQCPRTLALRITAQNGRTLVQDTGGPVTVEQAEGAVTVEHAKGALILTNHKGAIDVTDCAGPLEATATAGALSTRGVYGKQTLVCEQAKTVIDAPHGEVWVRNRGGDVRIIALEGIGGNYDVQTDHANLSMVLPGAADAQLLLEAKGGQVRVNNATASMTGSLTKDVQSFLGTLGAGQFKVTLKTDGGDIILD